MQWYIRPRRRVSECCTPLCPCHGRCSIHADSSMASEMNCSCFMPSQSCWSKSSARVSVRHLGAERNLRAVYDLFSPSFHPFALLLVSLSTHTLFLLVQRPKRASFVCLGLLLLSVKPQLSALAVSLIFTIILLWAWCENFCDLEIVFDSDWCRSAVLHYHPSLWRLFHCK